MVALRESGARSASPWGRETVSVAGFLVAGAIGAVLLLSVFYVLGMALSPDCNPDACPEQFAD
jgi:hypothetical protein